MGACEPIMHQVGPYSYANQCIDAGCFELLLHETACRVSCELPCYIPVLSWKPSRVSVVSQLQEF